MNCTHHPKASYIPGEDERVTVTCALCGEVLTEAAGLFASSRTAAIIETSLWNAIGALFGGGVDEVTFDDYDESAEVYCPRALVPTEEQKVTMAALGFARFWLHDHVDRAIPCKCPHYMVRKP